MIRDTGVLDMSQPPLGLSVKNRGRELGSTRDPAGHAPQGSALQTAVPLIAAGTGVILAPQPDRTAERGVPRRAAHGYYIVAPQEQVGRAWLPGLEAAAAGIASTIYGADRVVVMGVSAARLLGVIPRALATAVVAVPR